MFEYLTIVNVFGTFMNLICCLIFIKIIKKRAKMERNRKTLNQMYKYFLLKAICDLIINIIYSLNHLIDTENDDDTSLSLSYIKALWSYLVYQFGLNCLLLASGLFEITANFDCALSIDNCSKWFHKTSNFIYNSVFILLFCFVFHSFTLFLLGIKKTYFINKENVTIVKYTTTLREESELFFMISKYSITASEILRDVLVLIFLIFINVFILIKLKRIRIKKRLLNANSVNRKHSNSKAAKAEFRKIQLITVLCLIYIIGHFPNAITVTLTFFFRYNFNATWFFVSDCLVRLSYSIPILVYFIFDRQFYTITIEYLKALFKKQNSTQNNNNNKNTLPIVSTKHNNSSFKNLTSH
jgi:hypothetical protein